VYFADGPGGLVNMTRVEHSMPAFLSKPHFLDADDSVRAPLRGDIVPDRSQHDTLMYVEPYMGTTMLAYKRIQANWFLQPLMNPFGKKPWFPNVVPAYYPVAWFEETGEINEDLANQFKGQVYFALDIIRYTTYIPAILAALCLLVGANAWWRSRKAAKSQTHGGQIQSEAGAPAEYSQLVDET